MGMKDTTLVRLLKSQRVLDFNIAESDEHDCVFLSEEDGTQRTRLVLNRMDMVDFGQPLQVTVTIEPGDLLNEGVN